MICIHMIAYRIAYSSFSFLFILSFGSLFAAVISGIGIFNRKERCTIPYVSSFEACAQGYKAKHIIHGYRLVSLPLSHTCRHSIYSRAFIVPAAPPFIKRTTYRCRATAYFFQNNIVRRCAFAFVFVLKQTLSGELG